MMKNHTDGNFYRTNNTNACAAASTNCSGTSEIQELNTSEYAFVREENSSFAEQYDGGKSFLFYWNFTISNRSALDYLSFYMNYSTNSTIGGTNWVYVYDYANDEWDSCGSWASSNSSWIWRYCNITTPDTYMKNNNVTIVWENNGVNTWGRVSYAFIEYDTHCIDITANNATSKDDGFLLNDTYQTIYTNRSLNKANETIWLWADLYTCPYETYRYATLDVKLKSCCYDCESCW